MRKIVSLIILVQILFSLVSVLSPVRADPSPVIYFMGPDYSYLGDTGLIRLKVASAEPISNLWLGVDLVHRRTFDNQEDKSFIASSWNTLYSFSISEPVDKVSVKVMARIDRGIFNLGEGQATLRAYWTPAGGSEVAKGMNVVVNQNENSYTVKDLLVDEPLGASGVVTIKAVVAQFNLLGVSLDTDWAMVNAERRVEATKTPIKPAGALDYGGIDFGNQQGLSLTPGTLRVFTASYTFSTSKAYGYSYTYGAYYWDIAVWQNGYPGQSGASIIGQAKKPFTITYTFDIAASIEWKIDPSDQSEKGPVFVSQLAYGLRKASDYLFDASDGQMCFGKVSIYDNKENWQHVTLQINDETVGDNWWDAAWPKCGPSYEWDWPPVATVIGMGRKWIYKGETEYDSFDDDFAWQTIVHEFGHLQLGLQDEYMSDKFLYTVGQILEIILKKRVGDATCPCLMCYSDVWSEFCNPVTHNTDTWQEKTNHKSCWSTIKEKYPWVYIPFDVNTGPQQEVGNDINFESSLLPKPAIVSVSHDTTMSFGSVINIDVKITNQGAKAAWQTIGISFPIDQPTPTKITKVQSDLETYSARGKDESVTASYSTKTVTLETYLLEGASSNWQNGVTHQLKLAITPSTSGSFYFYVKSVAGLIDTASNWAPNRLSSTILDQQQEYVEVHVVQVGGITNELSDAVFVNKDSLLDVSTQGDSGGFHVFTSPVGFLSATDGDTFLIMSTGIAENTPGSPEEFESTDFGAGGATDDTVSLTLEMFVPNDATTLSFDFRFMSEEYPEYVGSDFNDFFYAYLTDSAGTRQIAFDDNGNIINVNNNFFNPNIYPIGTVFDGATKRLTTTVNVNSGETITLQFVVGDAGDGIYDTAVFLDNVRFNVGPTPPGTTPTADVIVVKNGPNNVEKGHQFSYTINYFNIEEGGAQNVVVTDNLPSQVTFVSASNGGIYSTSTHSVTWNLGSMAPFSSGSLTLTVMVPSSVSTGTVLQNTAAISTSSQESSSNNNQYVKSTTVTVGASLPPNVDVSPTISNNNGVPVVYWTTPVKFTYHGDSTVTGVGINIHLSDGGPDIGGAMTKTPSTYDWTFMFTFYPRHGLGTVTYTVHRSSGPDIVVTHNILVDPSGYVYNAVTGERLAGVTVTLYRYDTVLQQFVFVNPSDPNIEPHVNPQVTDENGAYAWMVSSGMYMVTAEKDGYQSNSMIVTVPPPAMDVNIPLTPNYFVAVTIDPPSSTIQPGNNAQYTVTVQNLGFFSDSYDVSIQDLDQGWCSFSANTITIDPGQTVQVTLTVTVPYASLILKDYAFEVIATSQGDPSVSDSDSAIVTVTFTSILPSQPAGGLAVAVKPKTTTTSPGTTVTLAITVNNNENFDDTFSVNILQTGIPTSYQTNLAWFSWTSCKIFIPKGSSITVQLTITIPQGTSIGNKIFKAEAKSSAWTKGCACDSGIIRVV